MAGDESSEQTNEWKPQGLADVLEVLGCFEENQLDANEMPMELIMDLDSIEIENTLDDSFDGFVQTREGGKASLEMSDGSLLICSLSVVRRSAYLSDMSKAFDSLESLPIPSIVGNEEMKRLIVLTELLESQDEREHEDLVRHHLVDIDLPALLRLLKAADFLSCSLTSLVEGEVIKLVNIENWTKVFLSCHSVMGLKTLQEFLLDFLLHQESDSDGEKVKLGEDTPVRFIKSVLEQTKFPICEEAKLDLVLDWAAKSESATEEEKIDVLGKVKLKCFDEVDTLEQLKIDIHQVDFIDEECRENYLLDINEAIEFKKQPWDLSFDYVRGREKLLDMRELLREKSNLPWPKLVGLFPRNSSNSKYRLLNNSSLQLQGKLGRLADLSDRVDTESLLCYRTSLFFISTSEDKLPSLCQQNFDLNLTFHVLDLPSALRSINDEYHCRSGQFAICQVAGYLYLIAVDTFSPMAYDSLGKRGMFRLNLDLAIESCNQALAIENASILQWEHVTDIPEEFLISSPNRLFNGDSIKMVGVHDSVLILTDDICVEFNVGRTEWKEVELAPPARSNPIVIASQDNLFIIGGSCMGKHLVSGQQYDTKTWKMNLLPNIPASVMMRLDLKHYHGLHHGNKLYLSYTWPNTRSQKHNSVCSQNNLISSADQPRPLLVYDIFLKQWSSETLSNTRLFCLDRPVWM